MQLVAVDSTAQLENEAEATVKLSARFLAHDAANTPKVSPHALATLNNLLDAGYHTKLAGHYNAAAL